MSSPDFSGTSRFELITLLGEGGSGVVYEAFDRHQRVEVALKLLRHHEGAALLKFKDEFRRFCQLLPSIDNRNLVSLYELFDDDRYVFFTMELIRGRPLVPYVRSSATGSADIVRLRSCFAQVGRALSAIHSLGIVHCDIKPSNVLVTDQGRAVVLDFGIATERVLAEPDDGSVGTTTSTVFGTVAYMAPEQATSRPVTPAADWYSFGVVLYQALTGVLPFTGAGFEVLDAKQWQTPKHPGELVPDVPADLADLAMELLDPDPRYRPDESEVLRCFSAAPAAPAWRTASVAASEPFVGRREHLETLDAALAAHNCGKTVIVLVSGRSGMGKTGLIHHFLERASERESNLLALESRCYESESMPYKAIDPIVDALARHWKSLGDVKAASLLPQHATVLARLFPVLWQIPVVATAPLYGEDELDSFTLRQRAAEALRDLLWRLGPGRSSGFDAAADAPLVLTIDDAQWGDLDSVSILQQVLQGPDPPPLLLIAAYRSEDAKAAPFVEGLRALSRNALNAEVYELDVGPLSAEDVKTLAVALTARMSDAEERIDTIGREAGGNAFFIHELARHATARGGRTTLDGVVLDRLHALPDTAQRFMLATVLSAQPLPSSVGRSAAGLTPHDPEWFQVLLASRLVRTKGGSDEPTFEAYHDRIREIVGSRIAPNDLTEWHKRLATAWEASTLARPETLVTHFQGAADDEKTRHYAEIAARNADEALAFDRAADFYQLLVALEQGAPARAAWYEKKGEALANSGRGYEAVAAFRRALLGAPPNQSKRVEIERRVATELIRAGYLDEAVRELDHLLPQVGVRALRTEVRAFGRLLWYRLLLTCRGVVSRDRASSDIAPELLRRIDVLLSISEPLCLTSLVRGQALLTQGAWSALRAGEHHRTVRALTGLAVSSSVGGTRATQRSRVLLDAARARAATTDDVWTQGRIALAEGMMLKLSGQFEHATMQLALAMAIFTKCRGVRWEVEAAQNMVHDSHLWMGEWNRLSIEIASRLQTARQRGDLFAETYLKARTSPVLQLGADRIDQATLEVGKSLDDWVRRANDREPRYDLQHRYALCTWLDVDLYKGTSEAAEAADRRLTNEWPRLRAVLFVFQFARVEMICYRARIALAMAARHGERALRRAEQDAHRLARENAPWAGALAQLIRATVSQGRGSRERAVTELVLAENLLRRSHLNHYAAAAQYRRGQMIGGQEGATLTAAADTWMRGQQMLNVDGMSNLLAPGPW